MEVEVPTEKEMENFQSAKDQMAEAAAKDPALEELISKAMVEQANAKKIEKAETGRVLGSDQYRHVSRGEAIKAAMDGGLIRSQARLAYRNQKNAMSSNGFTGNEMKQHAR
jgi:hypothetical protein